MIVILKLSSLVTIKECFFPVDIAMEGTVLSVHSDDLMFLFPQDLKITLWLTWMV